MIQKVDSVHLIFREYGLPCADVSRAVMPLDEVRLLFVFGFFFPFLFACDTRVCFCSDLLSLGRAPRPPAPTPSCTRPSSSLCAASLVGDHMHRHLISTKRRSSRPQKRPPRDCPRSAVMAQTGMSRPWGVGWWGERGCWGSTATMA